MTAKEYLKQLWYVDDEINEKLREIEYLRTKAENCSAAESDGMPKGAGTYDKISEIVIRIVDLQTYVNIRTEDLFAMREKITKQIDGLKNQQSRIILSARYMRQKQDRSWSRLEKDLSYEASSLHRLHRSALREFEQTYPEIRKL